MKKTSLFFVGVLLCIAAFAQTVPHSISYQAVARSTSGTVVPNTTLSVIASILNNSPTGTVAYSEKFSVSTNQYGLFTMHLGQGTPVTGTFDGISWGGSSHWLKIEIDFANTGLFTLLGTSELLSVPYALYSENSGTGGPTGPTGADGAAGPQGVSGPTGADGVNGITGPTGPAGANGTNGTNGTNGLNGATGPTGPAGINGINGINGVTGPTGPQGITGPTGSGGGGGGGATGPTGPTGPAGSGGGASMKGVVNGDGTISSGTGYTVTHVATGEYNITFTSPLSSAPTLTVTPEGNTIPAPTAYCTSTHASGCSGDDITNVTLNTLNNATSGCGGTTHYSSFTGGGTQTTTLAASASYTINVSFGTDPNQYFGAWIDYNHDLTFQTTEFLGASANAGASGTTGVTFTVPATTANGTTVLRVIGGNDNPLLDVQACGASSSTWGETQDYNITITGGSGAAVPPSVSYTASSIFPSVAAPTVNGFKVFLLNSTGTAVDQKFHFTAN